MICARCGASDGRVAATACGECGADPRLDGRYRLEALLGQGTHGMTYRARSPDGALVAVKMVNLGHGLAEDKRSSLDREVAVLATIEHPQIPAMIEDFTVRSGMTRYRCIVQTFVDGPDLATLVRQRRPALTDVLAWIAELADVLDWLHGRAPPIIHRDLKPENVLHRTRDGALVLIDFGSVRDSVVETLGGTMGMGTAGYMAPEQIVGDVDPRSDIFSLGATAIALATRAAPHDLRERGGRLAWPSAGLPAGFVALVDRMIDPDPQRRPSAAEVRDAARRLADDPHRVVGGPAPVARVVPATEPVADAPPAVIEPAPPTEIRDARRARVGLWLLVAATLVGTISAPAAAEVSAFAGLFATPVALYTAIKSWQAGSRTGAGVALSALGLVMALFVAVNVLGIGPYDARTVFPLVLVPFAALAAIPTGRALSDLSRRADPEKLPPPAPPERALRPAPPVSLVKRARRASLVGGGAMLLAGLAAFSDIESFMISAPAAVMLGIWLTWRGHMARMRLPTLMGLSMPAAAFALYVALEIVGMSYWDNRVGLAWTMLVYGAVMAVCGVRAALFSRPELPEPRSGSNSD